MDHSQDEDLWAEEVCDGERVLDQRTWRGSLVGDAVVGSLRDSGVTHSHHGHEVPDDRGSGL